MAEARSKRPRPSAARQPRAAATQRKIEAPAKRPKLAFILSADFGNLSDALYFVKDQPFDTVILMPERLYTTSQELPVRALKYTSPDDIVGTVTAEQPDIVFLFSGYLMTVNGIFDVSGIRYVVQRLREQGVRLVTSDPFLGLLSRLHAGTFNDEHPRHAWLVEHFGELYRIFKDVPHLYLAEPREDPGVPAVWFFNERILTDAVTIETARRMVARTFGVDPARPRWLFVLSAEDYGFQLQDEAFHDVLHARLEDAVRAGRQPVLLAPDMCVTGITTRAPITGLLALTSCAHGPFTALLQDAEYAFYWNVFSNSIPVRGASGQPLFFFDKGHMTRAIPPVFEVGMRWYYPGATLPYLDLADPLELDDLARRAAEQRESMAEARENFRRSPTPEALVQQLLARP